MAISIEIRRESPFIGIVHATHLNHDSRVRVDILRHTTRGNRLVRFDATGRQFSFRTGRRDSNRSSPAAQRK